jgi:hypothetical protein
MEVAESRMPDALVQARRGLPIPVAMALPGVSHGYARRSYTLALRRRIEPLPPVDDADTYSPDIGTRRDALVERAAIEFVTTHRALARGGLGLLLPSLPPEAFGFLAQLERHFEGPTQRGSSVWRLLDRLGAVTEQLWTDASIALAARAAPLTAFTNFPIGLLRLPWGTPLHYAPEFRSPIGRCCPSPAASSTSWATRGLSTSPSGCASSSPNASRLTTPSAPCRGLDGGAPHSWRPTNRG